MYDDVRIRRDENGVPHVEAASEEGLCWGMGRAHATDRGLQMLLMRILGQGRVSEILDGSDASLEIDRFFRRMNWAGNTDRQKARLSGRAGDLCRAYCDGANEVFSRRPPWELRLLGYRPEPWCVDDILMLSRMIGYLTMAQSQGEAERLLVEMVQAGVSRAKLDELFPGILGGLDMELLRKVRLGRRIVPPHLLWASAAPRPTASNNWTVAGSRTASGRPLLSNDPHLEVNRLPAVWCEIALRVGEQYAIGGSMPGAPGVFSGRTRDLAWGATYSFLDAEDSWVEHCRDGCYFREEEGWLPFGRRREVILRKGGKPVEVVFHENEHGVLDGDPEVEGYYLATRWTVSEAGGASLNRITELLDCETVEQGMEMLGALEVSFNFVLADRHGNIGYQMSGLMPLRGEGLSGLVPLPGWKKENDWRGFVPPEHLPRCLNPERGYFSTANEDLNRYGKASPINMPMGPYRAERINALLDQGSRLTPEDMYRMHRDVFSPQAEAFMAVLAPLLPDSPNGRILKTWDLCYEADSEGAYLFEAFYRALFGQVFGEAGLGRDVADHLQGETGILSDFYHNFDRVMLSETSAWFDGREREAIYQKAMEEALATTPLPWGEVRRVRMDHILFGGRLPRWLGFDRGPITIIGSRATVHQGQIFRSDGRTTSFCPSFRIVSDLSVDEVYTNLAGGPSDRRFSRWYCSDLEGWRQGRYKTVRPGGARGHFP